MRRIEKQMCAHPHVRLGHGSKDTAHVRVDTSYTAIPVLCRRCLFASNAALWLGFRVNLGFIKINSGLVMVTGTLGSA